MDLSRFEREAIEAIIMGEPDEVVLRAQLNNAEVAEREFTGKGVFVMLRIPAHVPLRSYRPNEVLEGNRILAAKHPKLENGAGVVLFMKDGYMNVLEGFTYGSERWPDSDAELEVYEVP